MEQYWQSLGPSFVDKEIAAFEGDVILYELDCDAFSELKR